MSGGDLDPVQVDPESIGHHLGHLDEQPLPHFRSTVLELNAAILVNMDQRTGLVQARGCE